MPPRAASLQAPRPTPAKISSSPMTIPPVSWMSSARVSSCPARPFRRRPARASTIAVASGSVNPAGVQIDLV